MKWLNKTLCWLGRHKWTTESSYFTKYAHFCSLCGLPQTKEDVTKVALYRRELLLWEDAARLRLDAAESYEYVLSYLHGGFR